MNNSITIVGRIAGISKTQKTNEGNFFIKTVVAVRRQNAFEELNGQTDFVDIRIFGKLGEIFSNNAERGQLIEIQGNLHSYAEEVNGNIKREIYVFAQKISFIEDNEEIILSKDY